MTVTEKATVENIARRHGYNDYRWISGANVQVCQWVRFKCMFGCPSYGKKGGCPPSVPSIAECRALFSEYEHILVLHITARFEQPEDRKEWSRSENLKLLPLEREAFLAGYPKAFLLFMDEPPARLRREHKRG